jgi:outer membrane protein assembly factor BamB
MSNVNAKMICRRTWLLAVMLGAGTSGVFAATSADILEKAQLRGGIACVIGGEQVDTALGLAKEGGFVVHVLDSDATRVADAKHRLAGAGLLGRQVYVDALTGETLPYADNLVDLLVDTGALVTEAEVFRVLAPVRGKALLGEQVVARPALAGADDWTHRLHRADNNPVANDTAFQMPAMLQYLGMPMQTSFQGAMLVEGGRRIELSDWVAKKPDRNAMSGKLLARSLYSGQVLWQRALPNNIEPDTPICALDKGHVYLASGDAARVLVIDAETGRDLPSIDLADEGNLRVKWLAIEGGRLYALLGQVLPVRVPFSFPISREVRLKQTESGRTIVAWELKSQRKLWSHVEDATVDYHTIAVRNGRTYFYSEQTRLACLDSQGKQLWENRDSAWKGELKRGPVRNANTEAVSTLRVGPGQVWLSVPGITSGLMFSAEDGKLLWQGRVANTDFFTGDRFYTVGGRANPQTGEIVEQGHFSIGGWCGVRTWVPALESGLGHVAFGMRSPCGVGIFAAGGVVCVMPSQCDCWPSVRGAGGLVSAGHILQQVKQSPQHPLETGPVCWCRDFRMARMTGPEVG